MRNSLLLFILLSFFLISCNQKVEQNLPKSIIISGRIINYDKTTGNEVLTVYINDNGRATQLNFPTNIDSSGNFRVKFKRYYPQDVMISYKTNFRVIVHPGDSLHVEFNGNTNQRVKIFETVKYSGDAAELNQMLSSYLKQYFENRPNTKLIHRKEKICNSNEYKNFQDSVRDERKTRRDQFIKNYKPDKELINWINTSIQLSYYEDLLDYPRNHKRHNNLPRDWRIENSYFDFIESIPRIDSKSLIYADTRWLINRYLSYIFNIAWRSANLVAKSNPDSLIFHKIIELSPDNGLIKQLTLNEFVNQRFSKYELEIYENHQMTINEIIKEPYLIEPLKKHYNEKKHYLSSKISAKGLELNSFQDKQASELWSKILNDGHDKVIYIDCWAIWCGPCRAEFPHTKRMIEYYKNDHVKFVYLCFDSKENAWKALLNENEYLKGNHYLLNEKQGSYFKKLLNVRGFPTYVIVAKEGNIVRTGSSFRPSNEKTKNIINDLL
jgi:thiol-disulfide isomerase/thioredoxin